MARRAPTSSWPDPVKPEPVTVDHPAVGHSHPLPRGLLSLVIILVVGLAASIVLVFVQANRTDNRLDRLEQYVAGKGVQRDAENDRQDARLDAAMCDLLDQLPAGGLLDPVRDEYDCGPGIPVEQLPPEARQQLQDFSNGGPGEQKPAVKPRQPAPETTDAPTPTPTVAPRSVAPVQPAAPTQVTPPAVPAPRTEPPLIDLTPITDPLCTGLGLCL